MDDFNAWFHNVAKGHEEGGVYTCVGLVPGHKRLTDDGDDYAPVALHNVRSSEGLLLAQPRFDNVAVADVMMFSRQQVNDLIPQLQKWLNDTKAAMI